jgi:allantoin racemase
MIIAKRQAYYEDVSGESIAVDNVSQAELAVSQDKAEVICLGCDGMAGLDEQIRQRTGVLVVDGVTAAVTIAESLVRLGLSTSKVRTYATPRPKTLTGWPGRFGR